MTVAVPTPLVPCAVVRCPNLTDRPNPTGAYPRCSEVAGRIARAYARIFRQMEAEYLAEQKAIEGTQLTG